jgi:hypothetical protein
LRKAGRRPVQFWVPDTRDPRFRAEIRRQVRLLNESDKNKKLIEAWQKAADRTGWE